MGRVSSFFNRMKGFGKMKGSGKYAAWTRKPTRRRVAAFARGCIVWDATADHEADRAEDRALLEALPETGEWALIVFREEPEPSATFTSRVELLAAVDAVTYTGGFEILAGDRLHRRVRREMSDGRPALLFATAGHRQELRRAIESMLHKCVRHPARPRKLNGFPGGEGRVECCCEVSAPRRIAKRVATMACYLSAPSFLGAGRGRGFAGPVESGAYDGALGSERYADFHENGFMRVLDEPLSTFGLDVDTASYATMRRYLVDEKRLPPRDAVRLEEFVNYFSYSYPEPTGDVPLAVACELGDCPWEKSHRLLRVGVQARRVAVEKIPPANLVLLLDVSGSMDFNGGFTMMKKALGMLVEQLRDEDHVAIVTYANQTQVRLPATSGREKAKIRQVVESLECGGGTSGGDGLRLAYEEIRRNFSPEANNRVVLVTDGDFNIGPRGPKETERLIREQRGNGIFLTVLGVGYGNYQDATMKRLSTAGKGNYAYLDNLLEAKKVLVNEFGSTLLTVAKDVKLQLEFNPAQVASYRLLGYECRKLAAQDFADDKKDGGETGSGHSMTAFYELVPAGVDAGAAQADALRYQKRVPVASEELFTVKLRYKDPQGEASHLVETPVRAADIVHAEGPSEDYRFASAVAEFALLASGSAHRGHASYDALLERARGSRGADPDGCRAEFIRLVETARLTREPAD